MKLTVFFDTPYWAGVFEQAEDGRLSAAKVIFGSEPSDGEVYEFIFKRFRHLHLSPAVAAVIREPIRNPKRKQREANKQLHQKGISTKSQMALQLQQEQQKQEKKHQIKKQELAKSRRLFELKQKKKKEKHRGR